MNRMFATASAVVVGFLVAPASASAQGVLTGDVRLACEAILCLSSSTRPGECSNALHRYFSINHRRLSDTLRARLNFLELCPVANQTPEMSSLVRAISRGAGRCDAASLNSVLAVYDESGLVLIRNDMPDYCSVYTTHAYTDFVTSNAVPLYVGNPQRGGYWVESADYATALADYNRRTRAEEGWGWGRGWAGRGGD